MENSSQDKNRTFSRRKKKKKKYNHHHQINLISQNSKKWNLRAGRREFFLFFFLLPLFSKIMFIFYVIKVQQKITKEKKFIFVCFTSSTSPVEPIALTSNLAAGPGSLLWETLRKPERRTGAPALGAGAAAGLQTSPPSPGCHPHV